MDRQWKRFNFFDKSVVQNPTGSSSSSSSTTNNQSTTGGRVRTRGKKNNDHLDIKRIDITAATCCIAEKAVAAAAAASIASSRLGRGKQASSSSTRSIPVDSSLNEREHPVLILGDSKGSLHFVDVGGSGMVQEMPKAHDGVVTQLQYAAAAGLILSVGGGSEFRSPEEIAFSRRVVTIAESEIRREADHDRGGGGDDGSSSRRFGTLDEAGGGGGSGGGGGGGGAAMFATSGGAAVNSGVSSTTLGPSPTLKLWSMEDGGGGLFFPRLLSTVDVFGQQRAHAEEIVDVTILSDASQIAIGLKNGAVLVLRGDLVRRPNAVRRVWVQPAGTFPVTNVAFAPYVELDPNRMNGGGRNGGRNNDLGGSNPANKISLYVTTKERMISYPNLHLTRDSDKSLIQGVILDQQGCAKGCLSVDGDGNAVVGHDEGVFFYRPTERGPCYVFDGPKSSVVWCGRHMAVVTQSGGGARLQIYDLAHKFVAATVSLRGGGGGGGSGSGAAGRSGSESLSPGAAALRCEELSATELARLDAAIRSDGDVAHVLCCGTNAAFVLTTTHRVYALRERTLHRRLAELFQKHLCVLFVTFISFPSIFLTSSSQ